MGSEQNRFGGERRKRWGGCLSALSCFGAQKGGKRIVPATRITDGNGSVTQPNGPQQPGMSTQGPGIVPSLLAPPSSPASFTNSALPSTAQSPSCFLSLSANSPGGPSNAMFATGPYAHETQLVSPPVFSTFTTEPSTAPLTPPPELAHLTTPSSPDVPFARFLSSSVDLKNGERTGYSLYSGSPQSGLVSPMSRASNDCSPSPFQYDNGGASLASHDSNFFCPATFAQFYLDNPPFPHTGGRLSVSKESDVYNNGGNLQQHKQNRSPKQDVEEIEAYRASFGFSADEIITTSHYVEISDVTDESFSMAPFGGNKLPVEESMEPVVVTGLKPLKTQANSNVFKLSMEEGQRSDAGEGQVFSNGCQDHRKRQGGDFSGSGNRNESGEDDVFARMGSSKSGRRHQVGQSSSDAEIDYRRGRSLRDRKDFSWAAK